MLTALLAPQNASRPKHRYGSWAGNIIMFDDVDEPIEDLQDHM